MKIPVYLWILRSVAPHAGAWIEISPEPSADPEGTVAPHAGAWIEIPLVNVKNLLFHVAPHAGAWIEMRLKDIILLGVSRRSPCGGVD